MFWFSAGHSMEHKGQQEGWYFGSLWGGLQQEEKGN